MLQKINKILAVTITACALTGTASLVAAADGAAAPPPDPYLDIMRQPPARWDTLIERRREAMAERRRAPIEHRSYARRWWNNPYSTDRREAMDAYTEARRKQMEDRSDFYQERTDNRRRFYNPGNQARRDWQDYRRNLYRLQSLRRQEAMYDKMPEFGEWGPGADDSGFGGPGFGGPGFGHPPFGGPMGGPGAFRPYGGYPRW